MADSWHSPLLKIPQSIRKPNTQGFCTADFQPAFFIFSPSPFPPFKISLSHARIFLTLPLRNSKSRSTENSLVPNRTALYETHLALGAKPIDFGGWEMPVDYPTHILQEHFATRQRAGLFDTGHMGEVIVEGPGALE